MESEGDALSPRLSSKSQKISTAREDKSKSPKNQKKKKTKKVKKRTKKFDYDSVTMDHHSANWEKSHHIQRKGKGSKLVTESGKEAEEGTEEEELEEMQRSVARLRAQRLVVERLRTESEHASRRASDLERTLERVKEQALKASREALERERSLRSTIVSLEQKLSTRQEREDTVTHELRRLLTTAQRNENETRAELSRKQAELEDLKHVLSTRTKDLESTVAQLKRDKCSAEEQLSHTKMLLSDKNRLVQRLEESKIDVTKSTSKRVEEVEEQLKSKREEVTALRDKLDSLVAVHSRQKELLKAKQDIINESEKREKLLQATVEELEENMRVLREQLESSHQLGDGGLRRQLELRDRELEDARSLIEKLQGELLEAQFASRSSNQVQDHRIVDTSSQYKESLHRASVHRERMEIQLKSLSTKVHELQQQLLHEMAANASLSRQLEEERKNRTRVSKQRLRILSEFYEEENRLEETLGRQLRLPESDTLPNRRPVAIQLQASSVQHHDSSDSDSDSSDSSCTTSSCTSSSSSSSSSSTGSSARSDSLSSSSTASLSMDHRSPSTGTDTAGKKLLSTLKRLSPTQHQDLQEQQVEQAEEGDLTDLLKPDGLGVLEEEEYSPVDLLDSVPLVAFKKTASSRAKERHVQSPLHQDKTKKSNKTPKNDKGKKSKKKRKKSETTTRIINKAASAGKVKSKTRISSAAQK